MTVEEIAAYAQKIVDDWGTRRGDNPEVDLAHAYLGLVQFGRPLTKAVRDLCVAASLSKELDLTYARRAAYDRLNSVERYFPKETS